MSQPSADIRRVFKMSELRSRANRKQHGPSVQVLLHNMWSVHRPGGRVTPKQVLANRLRLSE
jgi:hypothetical protein